MASKRKPWSREKQAADEDEELLVFGYSCKLFRDDEKALYVERGKHLIPWMGDDRLMIDRYDGRGYLHDLEQYEARPGCDPSESLTEEELKVENTCDEERYAALYADMSEEELYHEEELKRLRIALASDGAYNEVHFTYGEESKQESYDPSEATAPAAEEEEEEEEQPFIAPEELGVPEGMEVPPTERMNAIIEKTALFVAQHGLQMEIVIKTKQAKNQQLLFMQFDHPLNPYYKHVIQCIKSGNYKPNLQKNSKVEDDEEEEDDDDDADGHYLHPSLLASKSTNSVQPVSNLLGSYAESYSYPTNSSYAVATSTQAFAPNTTYVQQRQGDDWYSLLVKQLKDKVSKNQSSSHSPLGTTPTRALSPSSTPVVQSGYAVSSSIPNNQVNSASDPSLPTPPGLEPVTLPSLDRIQTGGAETKATASSNSVGDDSRGTSNYLLRESHIPMPPVDVQPIVDKMAAYVAKNGKDFETVVLSKGDKRFEFLHPWHQFHPYYLFKKSVYEQQIRKEGRMDESANSDYLSAPVSFCIKSKEPEVGPLEKRNALASDESDSDETERNTDGSRKAEELKEDASEKQKLQAVMNAEKAVTEAGEGPAISGTEKARKKIEALELRMAEEKLKDRLAAAAREKLCASREKQLQQERKRRATLFLTMLKKDHHQKDDANSTAPMIGPQLPGVTAGDPNPHVRDDRVPSCADEDGYSSAKQQCVRSSLSEKGHSSNSTAGRSFYANEKRTSRRERRSSRSPSRSPSHERRHPSRRRSRSRSRTRRHTSKSRHSSPHHSGKKSKAKTPPAAYAVVRRSHSSSPQHATYRSHSRDRSFRNQKSSYSQQRKDQRWHGSRNSKSPSHHRSWRSRSRSRSRHRRRYSPEEARRSSSHTRRSSSRHGTKSPRGKRSPSSETSRRDKTASRSASPCEPSKTTKIDGGAEG